jgi:hypothetical protein
MTCKDDETTYFLFQKISTKLPMLNDGWQSCISSVFIDNAFETLLGEDDKQSMF